MIVTMVSVGKRMAAHLGSVFWLVPAACCVAALALGLVLPELDEVVADEVPFLFGGGPDGARALLSAITTSMISFTGLVFSITVVALQLASSQFSPRVLRSFLRHRTPQWALGVFTATFLYAVVVLRSVRGDNNVDAFVPQLAVTGAFLLLVASVALFIAYISHITRAIQVSTIIRNLGKESRRLLADRAEDPAGDPGTPPERRSPAQTIPATESGVVVGIDSDRLVALAGGADAVLHARVGVGDFVPAGAPLFDAILNGATVDPGRVRKVVQLSRERDMRQDLAFGFRQLVDIAERALSPGVNDPTTAAQALDEMHDLLRRLAQRPDPSGLHADGQGTVRLALREPGFADHLDLALDEILHYGADSSQVRGKVTSMLADLDGVARPEHRSAVRAKARAAAAGFGSND